MSEIISKGVELVKSSNNSYRDTILSPIVNDNGPFELNKVDGSDFSSTYTNSLDSISWRTASLLANGGYDLLVMRHRPWIKNIIVDSTSSNIELDYVDKDTGESHYKTLDYYKLSIDNFYIGELYYIIIKNSFGTTVLWKNNEEYTKSIPSVVNYSNRVIFYGNNQKDYIDTLSQKAAINGVFIGDSSESTLELWSNSEFSVLYGYDVPSDDRTSLRLFNTINLRVKDLFTNQEVIDSLSKNPGYVSEISNNIIYIAYELNGETKITSYNFADNKDYVNYYIYPSVGNSITPDSILYSKLEYSYPDKNTDYSTELRFKDDLVYPKEFKSSVIVATPDDVGIITILDDGGSYIKVFGKLDTIKNPDVTKYKLNSDLRVGYAISVGDILFVEKSDEDNSGILGTNSYAAYIDLPKDKEYHHGDYIVFNISGNKNETILFVDPELDESELGNISPVVGGELYKLYIKYEVSDSVYASKSYIDINKEILSRLVYYTYITNYDIDKNIIYIKRSFGFNILNISSCVKFNYWTIGSYDMDCIRYNPYKILSIYSKYPTSTDNIELIIDRNTINFDYNNIVKYNDELSYNEIGYDLTINRYSNGVLVATESFTFDFTEDGEFSYNKINSNIIELEFHKEYLSLYNKLPLLSPGTYNLYRGIYRDVTEDMMLSNIDNLYLESKDYELFIDGGIVSDKYREVCFNKLKSHENLLLFTVDQDYIDSTKFNYDYNKYINSVFCYPDIYLGLYNYPIYLIWLLLGLSSQYTGEVNIDGVYSPISSKYRDKLLTLDYDGYRYVLTHNYVRSYINYGSLVFPEVILVLSRVRAAIYYRINYQSSESSIKDQFYQLLSYIDSISNGVLMDVRLNSVKLIDRLCEMSVSFYFNNFRVDPINILIKINVN